MAIPNLNKALLIFATVLIVFLVWFLFIRKKSPKVDNTDTNALSAGYCFGQSSANLVQTPLVIGGTDSGPTPFVVKLGETVLCSGSLITPQWILSAAHCEIPVGSLAILGANNFLLPESSQQKIRIAEIIRHPNFNSTTLSNDIMLLRLERSATINNFVNTICLPGNWDLSNRDLTVYGWGNVAPVKAANISPILQKLSLREASSCKYSINNTTQLCTTASSEPLQTTCFGDSGGPIIISDSGNKYIVGIVSWGAKDVCENFTVNTRVSYFVPWIRQITGI